jgi:hypothetical protein
LIPIGRPGPWRSTRAPGFDSFDMADHYGSAEEIVGRFNNLVSAGSVAGVPGIGRHPSPNGVRHPVQ